jgi:DNA-binding CsgD family transcriptional regulator
MRDPIAVIEAAYQVDGSPQSWLQDLAKTAAKAFGSTHGAMAFEWDASSGDWVHVNNLVVHGLPPAFPAQFFNQPDMTGEQALRTVQIFTTCRFDSMHALVDPYAPPLTALLNQFGIEDMACINATDPTGRGCAIAVADRAGPYPARTVHAWRRISAHIAAGHRLRRTLEAITQGRPIDSDCTEAILRPNGTIEHAVGPAEPRAARKALQDALVKIDHARSRRESDVQSIELWRALVSGRWSIVEHFDSDGKRYYLAHKNDPELAKDRALTPREQQVLGYADLGHSNKLIAYSLGLAVSTVSTLLSSARRKLGSQLDLLRPSAE